MAEPWAIWKKLRRAWVGLGPVILISCQTRAGQGEGPEQSQARAGLGSKFESHAGL